MTKLMIEVDDEVAQRVAEEAAERGVAPEQLAGEAVAERFGSRPRLGFIGLGHSGRADGSGRVKELRAELAEEKLKRMADEPRIAEG